MKMGLLLAKHIKNELIKERINALTDENELRDIVKNDDYLFEIRKLAIKQISDNNLLREIIFDTSDTTYTKAIFDIREIAVKQITDEGTLLEVVNNYYDETVDTKYGLNVVKKAVEKINNEDILINIAEKDCDKEIINMALEKVNTKHEDAKTKATLSFDDDTKIKRMCAIDQIEDDETLMDIAMNAKYLDVREKALNKIKVRDEKVILMEDLILKEKEYHESVNEYITSDEANEENKQEIIDKASNLGVGYKRAGNTKKEKFYNEQCNLFKDN